MVLNLVTESRDLSLHCNTFQDPYISRSIISSIISSAHSLYYSYTRDWPASINSALRDFSRTTAPKHEADCKVRIYSH